MPEPAVVVAGAGYWGANLVREFAALGVLAGVCDGGAQALAAAAARHPGVRTWTSFAEALQHPAPAVAIATPAATHASLARQALLAGKDVFVEKPLALSVGDGEALVALARERGRVLMVGHLLWYHPAVLALRDLARDGALGELRYIYSHRLNIGKVRREENILWSFAPHDVSVILGLVGETPDRVRAHGGYYLHADVADVTVSLLSFPRGVQAHVFVSWLHPFKEQRLVVVGAGQMAVFDDVAPRDKLVLYPHTVEMDGPVPVARKAEGRPVPLPAGTPLAAECAHFLECVRTRATPRTDGEEGLRVLRVLARCEEALLHDRDGRGVGARA